MTDYAGGASVSALLIGDYAADRPLVHEIFRRFGWRLFEARDRRQAVACLKRHPVEVVLAESDVPRWHWKKILRTLSALARPPQLIVTSRNADECLWSEVLNFGAYDVLMQPLDRDELERVVASARRHFDYQPERARRAVAVAAQVA
jgi:sigma-B regulation protein RsbU (phosphoserine phosphatase)